MNDLYRELFGRADRLLGAMLLAVTLGACQSSGVSGGGSGGNAGGSGGDAGAGGTAGSAGTGGAAGSGGVAGTGGAAGTGGVAGTGGAAGSGGVAGAGGSTGGAGGSTGGAGGSTGGAGGSTGGTGGTGGGLGGAGGSGGSGVDPSIPSGLTYADNDLALGVTNGTITIARAPDETGVTTYEIAWLDATGAPVGAPIATLAVADALEHDLVSASVPLTATHIAARTQGASGASLYGPTAPADNFPRHADIGGAVGFDSVWQRDVARDSISGTTYLVVIDGQTRLSVRRCAADFSSCPEEQRVGEGLVINSLDVTVAGGVLYATTQHPADETGRLFTCPLDPTGAVLACAEHVLPGPVATTLTDNAHVAVNATAVYVIFVDSTRNVPELFMCPLGGPSPGSPCVLHDITGGAANQTGASIEVAFTSQRLYVAGRDQSAVPYRTRIFHCAFDLSGAPTACDSFVTGSQESQGLVVRGANLYTQVYGQTWTQCALAIDGSITSCVDGTTRDFYALGVAGTNDALYTVGLFPNYTVGLDVCPLDGAGNIGVCEAVPAVWSYEPRVLDNELFLPTSGTVGPALARCGPDALGHLRDCTIHDVPIAERGYHGAPVAVASSGSHLWMRTRSDFFLGGTFAACALGALGALGEIESCVHQDLAPLAIFLGQGVVEHAGRLYFLGLTYDAQVEAMVIRCDEDVDGLPVGCTTHALSGPQGSNQDMLHAYASDDGLFIAAGIQGSDTRMIACGFDASGAPTDCRETLLGTSLSAQAQIIVSRDVIYVVGNTFGYLTGYACPYDAATVSACTAFDAGSIAQLSSHHLALLPGPTLPETLLVGGTASDGTMTVTECALDLDGAVVSCAPSAIVTAAGTLQGGALAVAYGRPFISGTDSQGRATLLACDVASGSITACTPHDISAAQGDDTAGARSILRYDAPSGGLHHVTENPSTRLRPSVYSVRAW